MPALFRNIQMLPGEVTTMTFDGKVADATIFNTSSSMDLASAARSDGSSARQALFCETEGLTEQRSES